MPEEDLIAKAQKCIVQTGQDVCGPLANEASAVNDWQRLMAFTGAGIVAFAAHRMLEALAEIAPDTAAEIAASMMGEFADYDGYSSEMLHDLGSRYGLDEMQRTPYPPVFTAGDAEYDLTRQYKDRDGNVWRFLEWDGTEPAFISTTSGLPMSSGLAGFVERLPRLVDRHGPIVAVEPDPVPEEGPCRRCQQTRPLFERQVSGSESLTGVCARCWSAYEEARKSGTFLDWADAFDSGTDEQLAEGLSGGAR